MLLQSLGNKPVDGLAKLLDERRHPPEDMRILHNLIEIVTDLVNALQEGGVAVAVGQDDQPLPPLAEEPPRQIIRRQSGLPGLVAELVMLRLGEAEDDLPAASGFGVFGWSRHALFSSKPSRDHQPHKMSPDIVAVLRGIQRGPEPP